MDGKAIGKKLRKLRGNKTIAELSKEIGIKPSTIGMYETGERIPRDSIKIKYANYYNLTVGEIFFDE
jgi:transcriptional regulator with XRE-family HTH domain|nr:MAG TPA: Helix-turn-helix XRE-family like protein [Caudoviricetes sp.]